MKSGILGLALGLGLALAAPLAAQDLVMAPQLGPTDAITAPAEIRALLAQDHVQLAQIDAFGGSDTVFFTNLVAVRCGLASVHFGVNGAAATTPLPLEPCHTGTARPNERRDPAGFPNFVRFAQDSVTLITLDIAFTDGVTETATLPRAGIMLD